ncbi:MAG TPA: hypothetical protein VFS50_13210 [Meiothermus sp.]|nr:hypothetical protein [Meiothermus sp.]
MRRADLEEKIWRDIRSFLLNPGEALQSFMKEESPERNEVALLEKRLQALLEARARLLDLYLEGGVEKETYYARIEDLDACIREVQASVESARQRSIAERQRKEALHSLESLSAHLRDRIDRLTPEEKQAVARELVERVTVRPGKGEVEVEVHYRFGQIAPRMGRRAGFSPSRREVASLIEYHRHQPDCKLTFYQ